MGPDEELACPRTGQVEVLVDGEWQLLGEPQQPVVACTCHVVENPWTYYGIVEPGGALEPDYGCPVHFPENTSAAEKEDA